MVHKTNWRTDCTDEKDNKAALADDCRGLAHRLAAGKATWQFTDWRIHRYRHIRTIGTCSIGMKSVDPLNSQTWVGNQGLIDVIVESLNHFSRVTSGGQLRLQVEEVSTARRTLVSCWLGSGGLFTGLTGPEI